MSMFEKLVPPTNGEKISFHDNQIHVPDQPIIPFIAGDGIGPDIWNATQPVLDSAVEKAYHGKKKIVWFQIHAGLSALRLYGNDQVLPNDTLNAI